MGLCSVVSYHIVVDCKPAVNASIVMNSRTVKQKTPQQIMVKSHVLDIYHSPLLRTQLAVLFFCTNLMIMYHWDSSKTD